MKKFKAIKSGSKRVVCTNDFVFETKAINLEIGTEFVKRFNIPKGTYGTLTEETDRIVISLDQTLIASNEDKSPYESKLYRVFIYNEEELKNWKTYLQ